MSHLKLHAIYHKYSNLSWIIDQSQDAWKWTAIEVTMLRVYCSQMSPQGGQADWNHRFDHPHNRHFITTSHQTTLEQLSLAAIQNRAPVTFICWKKRVGDNLKLKTCINYFGNWFQDFRKFTISKKLDKFYPSSAFTTHPSQHMSQKLDKLDAAKRLIPQTSYTCQLNPAAVLKIKLVKQT